VPVLVGATWSSVERVPLLQGWNVLVPRTYSQLFGRASSVGYEFALVDDPQLFAPDNHVLDLLRDRIVVLSALARDAEWAPRLAGPRWRRFREIGDWRFYENTRARPVAWLVHRVRVAGDDEAVRLVRGESSGFDPGEVALMDGDVPGLTPPSGPEEVRVVTFDDDAVDLHVTAAGTAVLVTSELAAPGWRATIDGTVVPLRTANAGFRAVVVDAGSHAVAFRYRPPLGRIGLALGAVSLLALVGCWWCGRRRDAAEPASGP
jgi:hypothetical protein